MKRNKGLDFLKCICSFMVICIHTISEGWLENIIIPISRIAVPLFFMISGYYYTSIRMHKREKEQIIKIFRMLIISNMLYFIYNLLKIVINNQSITEYIYDWLSIKSVLKFLLINESPFAGHLWYLGAILYVLLIIYFWEKYYERKKLYSIIPILLLGDIMLGKYSLLIWGKQIPFIVVRNFLFVGIPYFLIGDFLFNHKIKIKRKYLQICILFFTCTTLIEKNLLIHFNLNAIRDHYISTTLLAIVCFLLSIRSDGNCVRLNIFSNIGAKLTTGIYIIHPIIIDVINKIIKNFENDIFDKLYFIKSLFVFVITIILMQIINVVICKIRGIRCQVQ